MSLCRPFAYGAMTPSWWLAPLLVPRADLPNAAHTGVSELDVATNAYCIDDCNAKAGTTYAVKRPITMAAREARGRSSPYYLANRLHPFCRSLRLCITSSFTDN